MVNFRALSDLVSRRQLTALLGRTFGGNRDPYVVLGYKEALTPRDYRFRYERDEIAARVCEALPKATWRGGGELIEDEDPERVTDFENAWIELETRLKVWPVFERADILAGLGRFSIILIGAPGGLLTPLVSAKPEQIAYLKPFSEQFITISDTEDLERDATSPRFGLPNFYRITSPAVGQPQLRVHYTRVIHVADGLLDDDLYSSPRLQRIWNRLDDLMKVVGGGAEAFWLRANQGLHINIDKELAVGTEEKEDLTEQAEAYAHSASRIFRTRGVEVNTLGSDVAQFDKSADSIISLIAAGTGIPQRILMGSERGELASTQDEGNWEQRVSDRRKSFAGPFVVRALVDRLIAIGALPSPQQYEIRWPEAMELDDVQRVELAKSMATVNKEAGETVIMPNEIRDRALGWDPLTDEDLEAIPGREEAVDVEPVPGEEDEDEDEMPRAAARRRTYAKIRKLKRCREDFVKKLPSTKRQTLSLAGSAR